MISFLIDLIHYLIGLIIVGFLVWSIIKLHTYFSKNNISFDDVLNTNIN